MYYLPYYVAGMSKIFILNKYFERFGCLTPENATLAMHKPWVTIIRISLFLLLLDLSVVFAAK